MTKLTITSDDGGVIEFTGDEAQAMAEELSRNYGFKPDECGHKVEVGDLRLVTTDSFGNVSIQM